MDTEARVGSEFFFIPGARGQLFAAYFTPPDGIVARGRVLWVPPFAEEMNRSRRMMWTQARAFARLGASVLAVDPYGCGDSAGEFVDADWSLWRDDLGACSRWLESRVDGPLDLWTLRAGALLAMDALDQLEVSRLILWQPVCTGTVALREFLRIFVAGEMMGGANSTKTTTTELLERLLEGETLEIAGYELNPGLARAMSEISLDARQPRCSEAHWFEVTYDVTDDLNPKSLEIIDAWQRGGVCVSSYLVTGSRFWNSAELTECPDLVAKTCEVAGA